jgi:hypothetical protein
MSGNRGITLEESLEFHLGRPTEATIQMDDNGVMVMVAVGISTRRSSTMPNSLRLRGHFK